MGDFTTNMTNTGKDVRRISQIAPYAQALQPGSVGSLKITKVTTQITDLPIKADRPSTLARHSCCTGVLHIAVPTKYAGSEMTQILGETAQGSAKTIRAPTVLPNTVVYDVELTLGVAPRLSAVSGLNATAHAVELLYARDADPNYAAFGGGRHPRPLCGATRVFEQTQNIEARSNALYRARLYVACLGRTSMALHHKLCHVLGGAFAIARTKRAIGRGGPAAASFDLNTVPGTRLRMANTLL